MRIVFMGASELGWECCRELFNIGQHVVGILTIPPVFSISWSPKPIKNVRYKSFTDLAEEHGIPLINVTKKLSDPEYKSLIRELQPDIIIVVGWYYMLPRSLRALAPLGAVGIHASLLPKYRGGAPLVWAIIEGEQQTGVTLFHLADGTDDGDIIGQVAFPITPQDDIGIVVRKATRGSLELIRQYVPMLASGRAPRTPQDHTKATFVAQRTPEDGLISWGTQTAMRVYNWVRAQTRPYPGAFTYLDGQRLTIWKASVSPDTSPPGAVPGLIVDPPYDVTGTCDVCCADGKLLRIHEVGLPDGSVMAGDELVRRYLGSARTALRLTDDRGHQA